MASFNRLSVLVSFRAREYTFHKMICYPDLKNDNYYERKRERLKCWETLIVLSLLILALIGYSYCRPDHHSRNCKAYRRPALNEVLTRICLLCHEMFSVDQPNMAAECSSNCFRNPAFNKCLNFFRPKFSPYMIS